MRCRLQSRSRPSPPQPDVALETRLDIDLSFSLAEPGSPEPLDGTITASGSDVVIMANHPELLSAGRTLTLARLRAFAREVAVLGVSVTIASPVGTIASLGYIKTNLFQRLLTGSSYMRLGEAKAVLPLLRPRPGVRKFPLPPETLFPIIPTLIRNSSHRISTTHYSSGSGRPRLVFIIGSKNWDGTPAREFNLLPTTTTIGAAADADLQLAGVGEFAAVIRHTVRDEYLLEVEGLAPVTLRTGSRIEVGPWRMAFFREEFADHGRPWGGRIGGELSRQRPQPNRKHHFRHG